MIKRTISLIFLALTLASVSFAQTADRTTLGKSGYPLPRFMSLDDEITNMRTGPGTGYPIDWIYQRQDYPLKVIAEYENWFKVIDVDGTTGWIFRHLLSLKRYGIIIKGEQKLFKSPEDPKVMAIAEENVLGTILQCSGNWCEMEVGGFTGWLKSDNIWGALDNEEFD